MFAPEHSRANINIYDLIHVCSTILWVKTFTFAHKKNKQIIYIILYNKYNMTALCIYDYQFS